MTDDLPPAMLAPLADISQWLRATQTRAVLVGGVAVSLLSRPRFIDVILGGLEFERQVVEEGRETQIEGVSLCLPRVEHLLIMKVIANRAQDQLDVAALLGAHPGADLGLVRRWVREFASAMAMSSLVDDFERATKRSIGRDTGAG